MNRKWLPAALIALAAVASLVAYGRLPAQVNLEFTGLLPIEGNPTAGLAPRWLTLSLLPVLGLLMFGVFRLPTTVAGQGLGRRLFRHAPAEVSSPAQFERFRNSYDVIVLGMIVLFVGLHAAVLAAAFQASGLAARLVSGVLGVSLLLMGNVIPRLRPNWVAGLRSRRMLENPQLWRSAHRVFGAAFVVSGVATLGTAVLAPEYGTLVGIGSVLASCLIGYAASRRQNASGRRAFLS